MRELLKSASLRLLLAASLGTLTSCAVIRPPQGSAAVVTETLPTSGQRQDALERVRKIDQAMPAAVVTFNEIVTAALVDRQRLGYYSNRQHANLERAFLRIKRQATQLKSIDQRYAPWRSRARHGQEAASLAS